MTSPFSVSERTSEVRSSSNGNTFSRSPDVLEPCISSASGRLTSEQKGERDALLHLYHSSNGDNWRSSQDNYTRNVWKTSIPHCCWHGITCHNQTGLVQHIGLYYNNLTGTVPSSIFYFSQLEILYLSKNSLRGDIGALIPALPNTNRFTGLTLAFNHFEGIMPWTNLSTFRNLVKLQLAYNLQVKGDIPEDVAGLVNLGILSLGQTGISGQFPYGVVNLPNLWFLDLEDLQMTGNISRLPLLPALKQLHLKGNNFLGELPWDLAAKMPLLEELSLSGNLISGHLPDVFQKMPNLHSVDVSNNQLKGPVPRSLLQHPNISHIDASNNCFSSLDYSLIVPKLRVIKFSRNLLNMKLPDLAEHLEFVNTLEVLDFSDCQLTGTITVQVWYFEELISMNFSRNSISGSLTQPRYEMLNLLDVDFSRNQLSGQIPAAFSLLSSSARLNLLNNPKLKANNMSKPLPWFAFPNSNIWVKEHPSDNYSCPQIQFDSPSHGELLIDSSYYGKKFCNCSHRHYGHSGQCNQCPKGGICNGDMQNSTIQLGTDFYPSLSPTVGLTNCRQAAFRYKNRCNPTGDCQCWLSDDGKSTVCNQSCLCAVNTTGRLCSQCSPNTHVSLFGGCAPCTSVEADTSRVLIIVGCLLAVLLVFWTLKSIRPCKMTSKFFTKFKLGGAAFEAILIIVLTVTGVIPTFVAEAFFLAFFLIIFSQLKTIKVFLTTVIVFLQIIGTIQLSNADDNCKFCTLDGIMETLGFKKLLEAVNFHFGGLACAIPWLFTPIGKLIFLGLFPFSVGVVIVIKAVFDYYFLIPCCRQTERVGRCRKKTTRWAKSYFIFTLNLMYYPIVNTAV